MGVDATFLLKEDKVEVRDTELVIARKGNRKIAVTSSHVFVERKTVTR